MSLTCRTPFSRIKAPWEGELKIREHNRHHHDHHDNSHQVVFLRYLQKQKRSNQIQSGRNVIATKIQQHQIQTDRYEHTEKL